MPRLRPLLPRPNSVFNRPILALPAALPRRWSSASPSSSPHIEVDNAIETLKQRHLPIEWDITSPGQALRLTETLRDYMPPAWGINISSKINSSIIGNGPSDSAAPILPFAYHLVYFNPHIARPFLLPDGTDPAQSPGPPFTRRMWAGGSMTYRHHQQPNHGADSSVRLDSNIYGCVRRFRDIKVRGTQGDEKIFVTMEHAVVGKALLDRLTMGEEGWEDGDVYQNAMVREDRTLVFMRERAPGQLPVEQETAIPKPPQAPSSLSSPPKEKETTSPLPETSQSPANFRHTLTPDKILLFRYSALTWNAHSIHLDSNYCRNIEGHRNLLVHGPLSITMLMTMLNWHVQQRFGQGAVAVAKHVDYRMLAPLYADEPMSLCGRQSDLRGATAESTSCDAGKTLNFRLWIEGPGGVMACRADAVVRVLARHST